MRHLCKVLLALCSPASLFGASITVLWQPQFPTVESVPVPQVALARALPGARFATVGQLREDRALRDSSLLVLPYGSAFPVEAWNEIHHFLQQGGALLVLGGRPFQFPVSGTQGFAVADRPHEEFARELGILHSYEAPQNDGVRFAWRSGFEFLGARRLSPEKVFVLEGRSLEGLGYLSTKDGERVSAPVVESSGIRAVYLDFVPPVGYWESEDGVALIASAAKVATEPAHGLSIEMQFSTVRRGETPLAILHLQHAPAACQLSFEVLEDRRSLSTRELPCGGEAFSGQMLLPNTLHPGLYMVQAILLAAGRPVDFYENAFWVEDEQTLQAGPRLGVAGDFLTENGQPFFPFGSNYFSTESDGWDFSGPRNAAVWERDFAAMERNGMTFVRTGVWSGQAKFLDGSARVSERFLRNVEAYLRCARRHHIAVNFTFFAFEPQGALTQGQEAIVLLPGTNPYLDETTVRAEQSYVLSIVKRFKDAPDLSWDLINEPSFSNSHRVFAGNLPNNDPAEIAAWHVWLRHRYASLAALAEAWSIAPDLLGGFDQIPLPSTGLSLSLENGDQEMARAFDYNLFSQESFSGWVKKMSDSIRSAGSSQLIDVGQDEGGVENRVLNQFYGPQLSFTTNHTYRANQDLLWDSLAAKVPGIPNIVGETGYQPITYPDGEWHFDELSGFGLIERKWAAGFAGGASGALSWDWDREVHFGLLRSDGSEKTWLEMARKMGAFGKAAAAHASGWQTPEVALVLPQSLQLSVFNRLAIEAQQTAVRALYGVARSQAYTVGEYQLDRLGHPKLIIVPSPWVLNENAWKQLLRAANEGAHLLISGRFDQDEHFHSTPRAQAAGVPYRPVLLDLIENDFVWPGGSDRLRYLDHKPDFLQRAALPDGADFMERSYGKGNILFAAMPLELNANWQVTAEVYRYALKQAGVAPVYTTKLEDPGLIICPASFAHATLYFLSSDSSHDAVSFQDARSGKQFSGKLQPGRAALLLVGEHGEMLASYNW